MYCNLLFVMIVCFSLNICPPPGLLPVLGPLEQYVTPTLDTALLISSRVGADLGRMSDRLRSFVNWELYLLICDKTYCVISTA